MKNVIHIFGASGSGTSTLGRALADELGYTFMDTDDYFWLPTDPQYSVKRPKEERLALMETAIDQSENVVVSGSLCDWGDPLMERFTLAVRLVTDTALRIDRLKARERAEFGSRLDEGGDMYEAHRKFLAWAAAYDTGGPDMRSRTKHDLWQKKLFCPLLVLNGGADLVGNVARVREMLS